MPSRERRSSRAAASIERDLVRAGDELREARLRAGLRLEDVATAIGVSPATVLRTERAIGPGARPPLLAAHAAAVGLRARVLLYPDGEPLRDAPQVQLLRAFRAEIGASIPIDLERPVVMIPGSNDRRAFDAVLRIPGCACGVECYTRFHDCQAQLRSALLKQRDADLCRLILVVSGTRANRAAIRVAGDLIASAFPIGTRRVLAALRAGRDPGANGLVLL
jgi:transcriptional regulator with XRE-family HTH domain